MMLSSTISLDDGDDDDDEPDDARQYMNNKKYAYYYIHPSYSSHYYKVGGCVGAFFQLFDWNRRLHNSNSKRFFSPHQGLHNQCYSHFTYSQYNMISYMIAQSHDFI